MAEPTNKDLYDLMIKHQAENITRFTVIEKKQDYTNGDVNTLKKAMRALQDWKLKVETLEDFRKEQTPVIKKADKVVVNPFMTHEMATAVTGLLVAVATYLIFLAGGK